LTAAQAEKLEETGRIDAIEDGPIQVDYHETFTTDGIAEALDELNKEPSMVTQVCGCRWLVRDGGAWGDGRTLGLVRATNEEEAHAKAVEQFGDNPRVDELDGTEESDLYVYREGGRQYNSSLAIWAHHHPERVEQALANTAYLADQEEG
jgi:hypothetical protein